MDFLLNTAFAVLSFFLKKFDQIFTKAYKVIGLGSEGFSRTL